MDDLVWSDILELSSLKAQFELGTIHSLHIHIDEVSSSSPYGAC